MTLQWQIGNSTTTRYLGLWGTNPSKAAVQSRLAQGFFAPWYRDYIVDEESGFRQFNEQDGIQGTPYWGDPCGWGLTQQDPPGRYTTPYWKDIWNWQANVDSGTQKMSEKKTRGTQLWANEKQKYDLDEELNQDSKPPCVTSIGNNIAFCYDETLGKPWADANAIKCYNGCNQSYLGYDNSVHTWWFSSWAVASGYPGYVTKVLNMAASGQ